MVAWICIDVIIMHYSFWPADTTKRCNRLFFDAKHPSNSLFPSWTDWLIPTLLLTNSLTQSQYSLIHYLIMTYPTYQLTNQVTVHRELTLPIMDLVYYMYFDITRWFLLLGWNRKLKAQLIAIQMALPLRLHVILVHLLSSHLIDMI